MGETTHEMTQYIQGNQANQINPFEEQKTIVNEDAESVIVPRDSGYVRKNSDNLSFVESSKQSMRDPEYSSYIERSGQIDTNFSEVSTQRSEILQQNLRVNTLTFKNVEKYGTVEVDFSMRVK